MCVAPQPQCSSSVTLANGVMLGITTATASSLGPLTDTRSVNLTSATMGGAYIGALPATTPFLSTSATNTQTSATWLAWVNDKPILKMVSINVFVSGGTGFAYVVAGRYADSSAAPATITSAYVNSMWTAYQSTMGVTASAVANGYGAGTVVAQITQACAPPPAPPPPSPPPSPPPPPWLGPTCAYGESHKFAPNAAGSVAAGTLASASPVADQTGNGAAAWTMTAGSGVTYDGTSLSFDGTANAYASFGSGVAFGGTPFTLSV